MTLKRDLSQFREKALESADKERRAICLEILKSVAMMTPVDTGRARGNWQVSSDTPKRNVIERDSKSWSSVVSQEMGNFGKLGDTVYMTNNLPYIYGLEYGQRSEQAPSGMVRVTLARIRGLIANRRLSR
jgi:hypothetical protein